MQTSVSPPPPEAPTPSVGFSLETSPTRPRSHISSPPVNSPDPSPKSKISADPVHAPTLSSTQPLKSYIPFPPSHSLTPTVPKPHKSHPTSLTPSPSHTLPPKSYISTPLSLALATSPVATKPKNQLLFRFLLPPHETSLKDRKHQYHLPLPLLPYLPCHHLLHLLHPHLTRLLHQYPLSLLHHQTSMKNLTYQLHLQGLRLLHPLPTTTLAILLVISCHLLLSHCYLCPSLLINDDDYITSVGIDVGLDFPAKETPENQVLKMKNCK